MLLCDLQENIYPVLIGFNPLALARDVAIEKWHKTCKQVSVYVCSYVCLYLVLLLDPHSLSTLQTFLRLSEREHTSDGGMILNPIVGPEPITG